MKKTTGALSLFLLVLVVLGASQRALAGEKLNIYTGRAQN